MTDFFDQAFRRVEQLRDELIMLKGRNCDVERLGGELCGYLLEDINQATRCAREINKATYCERGIKWV